MVPPLVGVAVNVTLVPAQIVEDGLADMATLTGRFGFTVMVIPAEVAGLPVAQVALEVNTQVTTSPFARAELEYVVEFTPTLIPFNFH